MFNMRSLKIKSFSLLSILSFANAENLAVMHLNVRGGNKRSIGRIGALLPWHTTKNRVAYSSFFAMKDTRSGLEGNLGLGYRQIVSKSFVLGGYSFVDVRRSLDKKRNMYQANIGAELFFECLEFRVNGYLPITSSVRLGEVSQDLTKHYNREANLVLETYNNKQTHEVILMGYDLEFGGNIPILNKLKAYVGIYRFLKNDIEIKGGRFRVDYKLLNWLLLGGELIRDNERKWNNFADIKIQYYFDKPSSDQISILPNKLTLLPVRDVD